MPTQLLSRTRAVIFDFDGVLVDSEPISLGELQRFFAEQGVERDWHTMVTDFLGTAPREIRQFLKEQTGHDHCDIFPKEWEDRVLERFSRDLDLLTGAEALMDKLDDMNIPYCIASGSSADRLKFALEHIGQAARFENRAFSTELVARGKPAPDIFLHSAKALSVAPRDCMVIEDGIAGTAGAKAAGIQAIVGFVGGSHLSETDLREGHRTALGNAGASVIIQSLSDLLE